MFLFVMKCVCSFRFNCNKELIPNCWRSCGESIFANIQPKLRNKQCLYHYSKHHTSNENQLKQQFLITVLSRENVKSQKHKYNNISIGTTRLGGSAHHAERWGQFLIFIIEITKNCLQAGLLEYNLINLKYTENFIVKIFNNTNAFLILQN